MKAQKLFVILLGLTVLAMAAACVGCGEKAPEGQPVANAGVKDAVAVPQVKTPGAKAKAPDASTTTPVTITDDADKAGDPSADKPKEPEKSQAETLPEIVAKVGDEVISGKDFGRQLDYRAKMMASRGMPVSISGKMRQDFLDSAIKEKILLIVAKKSGSTVTDEQVKAELDKRKATLGDKYQKNLENMGLTEEQLLGLLKEQMIESSFVEQKKKDMTVSDEDLKADFDKMNAQGALNQPASTDVAHILIMVKSKEEADWTKAKEKIDAARARIVGGEAFEKVAQEVSEDPGSKDKGGLYPNTPKGRMVPQFDEKMESTPIGQVSEAFRTDYGWHILTVKAKHEAGTRSFDEMKEQLRNRATGMKLQTMLEQVVADARKDIKIEVLLPPPADEPAATPKPLMVPGAPGAPKSADAPPAEAPKPADAPKADAPPAEAPKPAEGAEKK